MSTYSSPRRRLQAEETRQSIVRAARRLFAERGYAATSMSEIAAEAGVAVQTIYASCGSKPSLLLALIDAIDEEADIASPAAEMVASEDPHQIIALVARLTRQLFERCGDIIGAMFSAAAAAEPGAAAAAAEGTRRHRAGCARSAQQLADLGALRDDVSAERAAALISVLTWEPAYSELTQAYGWSFDECEEWIASTLAARLLR